MFGEHLIDLPKAWEKKIKNERLLGKLKDFGLWMQLPLPTTSKGSAILKKNEKLLLFADKQTEDYAIEPYGDVFELIPASVNRQGVGISVFENTGMLCVDIYFFPGDFTNDPSRNIPIVALRQGVLLTDNEAMIQDFTDKYILTGSKSLIKKYDHCCAIPFSPNRVAILQGNFIDHFSETKRICENVVKGGSEEEKINCRRFLDFIKTVGKQ